MESLLIDSKQCLHLRSYLISFWNLLDVEQDTLALQLAQEQNMEEISSFITDENIRVMFLHKTNKEEFKVAIRWSAETIAMTNILFVKKKSFALDFASHQHKEMLQAIRLDFHAIFPIKFAFKAINNLINPLFENQFNEDEMKEIITMVQKKNKQITYRISQCKETVKVPTLAIKVRPFIEQILALKQEESYLKNTKKISDEQITSVIEDIQRWCNDIENMWSYELSLKDKTSLHEKYFWSIYLESLKQIEYQLDSEPIKFCISLLRAKKKLHAVAMYDCIAISFKRKVIRAMEINQILGSANIQELMTAQSFFELKKSQAQVLQKLKYLRRVQESYEILRLYRLLQCLSNEITQQMIQILKRQDIMQQQIKIVESLSNRVEEIAKQFQIGVAKFITRQTYGGYLHRGLQQRLKQIKVIKALEDNAKTLIEKVIDDSMENKNAIRDLVDQAIANFESINLFDLKNEKQEFKNACANFYERFDSVEYYIAKDFAFKIQKSVRTPQIIEIMQRFQSISSRPRIIQAFRVMKYKMLEIVQKDIDQSEKKLQATYAVSQNAKICMARQMPTKVGEFIWKKQIHAKLIQCKNLLALILTPNDQEGCKYQANVEILLRKANPINISKESQKEAFSLIRSDKLKKCSILKIIQENNKNKVVINLEDSQINAIEVTSKVYLDKLANNLLTKIWKQFEANFYEPFLSLQASLRLYYQTVASLDESILKLVAGQKNRVMAIMGLGFSTLWSNDVHGYSVDFEKVILNLHQSVWIACNQSKIIEAMIQSLDNCPLESDILRANMSDVQDIIYELQNKGMSNLSMYVDQLNKKIEKLLIVRLQKLIKEWYAEFVSFSEGKDQKNSLIRQSLSMEVKHENGRILLEPPLEHIKFTLLEQFHSLITIICSLQQIKLKKQLQISHNRNIKETYNHLLFQVDPRLLQNVYKEIFIAFNSAEQYLKVWTHYQSLWIEGNKIFDRLQYNINRWQKFMKQIKHNRQNVEGFSDKKLSGPLLINCSLIKQEVCRRYDYWYHVIKKAFDELLISKQKSNNLSDIEALLAYRKQKIKQKYARCEELKQSIQAKWIQIRQKQRFIEIELQKAQPALLHSKKQVVDLKRQQFQQLFAFQRPPQAIDLPLKALYYFLRQSSTLLPRNGTAMVNFPQVRTFFIQFDFLRRFPSFRGTDVNPSVRYFIVRQCLSSPEWNLERINRCSRVVGVMARWLEAQLAYADLRDHLQPLIKVIQLLSSQLEGFEKELAQTGKAIKELEKNCQRLERQLELQPRKIQFNLEIQQIKDQIMENKEIQKE